jgi:glucose-6-phosphate-specific signal transduction histidine kinase
VLSFPGRSFWCDRIEEDHFLTVDDQILPNRVCIAQEVAEKLDWRLAAPQLDLCVSHDMTLYTVRQELLNQGVEEAGEVEFLDGSVLYMQDGQLWLPSHVGQGPLQLEERGGGREFR